jgi:sirohydrochlorin cobaltochelatase
LTSSTAYLLVFHGSRDARSQTAAAALADQFQKKLHSIYPSPPWWDQSSQSHGAKNQLTHSGDIQSRGAVAVRFAQSDRPAIAWAAFLECSPLPLSCQIDRFVEFATSTLPLPCRFVILPVFLLPGVHVMEDIPAQVALTQQLHPSINFEMRSHLGAHPGLQQLVAGQLAHDSVDAWILLAHGSRRAGGNLPIVTLAHNLGVIPAYWSVSPHLEERLQELTKTGVRQVGIFPYFLFQGGITDAIAHSLAQLSAQFSNLHLTLGNPLNASPKLVDLLIEWATQETNQN